jgi:nitrogenase subunit NifH
MIDPVTAAAGAAKAYAMIQGMVSAGKSVEDTMGQIATWYGHAADVMYADQKARSPNPFRKVVFSKSVEQEAIKAFAAKKRCQEQQREIMLMIRYAYGDDGLQEFRAMKEKIVRERKRTIYRQKEMREYMLASMIILFGLAFLTGVVIFITNY